MKISKLLEHVVRNKYLLIYEALIDRASREERTKGSEKYYELHHIIPKSIAPEFANLRKHPWNGVLLTAKEHFIAHRLLCFFTTGSARVCSLRAYHAVCYKTRRATNLKPTSLQYRKAREALSKANTGPRGVSGPPRWADRCHDIVSFKIMLEQLVQEGLSDPEIGKRFGVSGVAINNWRSKLNIEKRRSNLKNADWLKEEYEYKRRSADDIAEELNCSGAAVIQYLKRFGITRRPGNSKNFILLEDKAWLSQQLETGRSNTDIANEVGCSRPTVVTAATKFNLI